jgi:hypothetical protein
MRHYYFREREEIKNFTNYNDYTPAIEDKGLKFKSQLTFNLMEIITKMKNKSSDNNNINKELLINLLCILNLCKEKELPLKEQKTGNENKIYSFYFPLKKIAIDNKINDGGLSYLNKGIISDFQERENLSENDSKEISNDLTNNSNKSLSFNNENIDDKGLLNENEIDFFECPILSDEKEKSEDYLILFNEIMKNDNLILEENNEEKKINSKDNIVNLLNSSTNNSTNIINNINNNFIIEKSSSPKNKNKIKPDPLLFYFNQSNYKNIVNSMNKNYIQLLFYHYKKIKNLTKSNFLLNENMKINLFSSKFKQFLLEIGINDITLYQGITKLVIFKKKIINFEEFLSCFDLIISLPDERTREKYTFLYYLPKKTNEQIYYTQKDINIFFKLIECSKIYEEELTDNITERLINRYNAIYQNDEKENLQYGKFNIRKLNVVLETFFDDYF